MTNGELQKLLQSFPQDSPVDVVSDGGTNTMPLTRVELKIDAAPVMIDKNIGWADIVKDLIRVRLVYLTPADVVRARAAERTVVETEP